MKQQTKRQILKPGKKYTFSDYFDFNHSTEEIVTELGYSFAFEALDLPQSNNYEMADIQRLKKTLYTVLPKIRLNSEMAKREFLIAPILMELAKLSQPKIQVEYPLDINDHLGGSLDYLIEAEQTLVVIEAKRGDLDKGFSQLSAELIALDTYEPANPSSRFYGAITIGDVWKFGILERKKKSILKDINSYPVPGDIETVFSILVGIVTASTSHVR